MTTAVASPPTFQALPRLGWNGGSTGGGFSAMSTEDVSRIFLPQRKGVQRSNSSSSLASTASSSSTITTTEAPATNGETAPPAKKKARGGFWPVSKAESTSGITSARANGSVQLSGKAPVQPALPSQNGQTNNVRQVNGAPSGDQAAILALLPMNGTFERKQINVPFFPDVLRVGRQTNAKTVPTPTNGFFDSKVLSRQHAEVWGERSGKVWIRDVKSSNGTFVNGQRLSPENRESEPHELRQHDTLELGIDIVSEDQKTIVHHKVSAKVEYVGLPGTTNNVLDLSFGDLDPSHGGALLPSPMSAPMVHSRRPGGPIINGRQSAASSVVGSQISSGAQSRQLNFWGQTTPLSVEQLVKSISSELRAARHQAAEIDQVGSYIDGFTTPEGNIGKEKPESPIKEGKTKLKSLRTDHLTRFADPPAPPPQQPLPEKPDSAKSSPINGISLTSLLKRTETAKPGIGSGNSPTNPQNSQMLQLVEALSTAKKELDSQAARVKQLEDMLKDERSARVEAEERAKRLEHIPTSRPISNIEEDTAVSQVDPPSGDDLETAEPVTSTNTATNEAQLQQKLETMVAEMQRMRADMDKFKHRAETSEADATKARETLAEMIDRMRQENLKDEDESNSSGDTLSQSDENKMLAKGLGHANGHVRTPMMPQLEHAVTTVLRKDADGEVLISAPYVSMLGVVLIGVGLMAYLNSWQKQER